VGESGDHSNDRIGDGVFFIPIHSLWMGHAKKAGWRTDRQTDDRKTTDRRRRRQTKPMKADEKPVTDRLKPFIDREVGFKINLGLHRGAQNIFICTFFQIFIVC
jgi:hypothetical protein